MLSIKVQSVTKRFGARTLFAGASFVVNAGEVAGVIGANGSGKSTLLRIIAGAEAADAGGVAVMPGMRIGMLRQGYAHDAATPVSALFPHAFADRDAEARIARFSAGLAAGDDVGDEYAAALDALAASDAGSAADAWTSLGLRDVAPDEPASRLSGGEQTKLALVDLVAERPDALLLDEPTNNLDLDALAWLDAYLGAFSGPVLVVSHDRALLDDHATSIIEVDAARGCVEEYAGGYEDYAAEKARREADLWARFRRQQEREARVQREIRDIKTTAMSREKTSQNDFYRRKAKKDTSGHACLVLDVASGKAGIRPPMLMGNAGRRQRPARANQ